MDDDISARRFPRSLRSVESRLPRTEYTLYGIFLESEGLLQNYHWLRTEKLYCNSLWQADKFANWDPDLSFGPSATGFFTVIQSNTGIEVDSVVDRDGRYLA